VRLVHGVARKLRPGAHKALLMPWSVVGRDQPWSEVSDSPAEDQRRWSAVMAVRLAEWSLAPASGRATRCQTGRKRASGPAPACVSARRRSTCLRDDPLPVGPFRIALEALHATRFVPVGEIGRLPPAIPQPHGNLLRCRPTVGHRASQQAFTAAWSCATMPQATWTCRRCQTHAWRTSRPSPAPSQRYPSQQGVTCGPAMGITQECQTCQNPS
jgi:hypothetical protein